jgi:hypothetical protein
VKAKPFLQGAGLATLYILRIAERFLSPSRNEAYHHRIVHRFRERLLHDGRNTPADLNRLVAQQQQKTRNVERH